MRKIYKNNRIDNPSIPYGILPISARVLLLYIRRMRTFEIIWRGAVLVVLAFLAGSYFLGGGILAGAFLLVCVPVWVYITLYMLNFI